MIIFGTPPHGHTFNLLYAQLKSHIPINLLMIIHVIFFSGNVTCPTICNVNIAFRCSPSQTKHLCLSHSECGSSRRSKCCATSRRGGCSLMCVTPRVLSKYSRVGKYPNPYPIPDPFRIFFVNRRLSITFTSKSRQTANANLYYVTKFLLYLSVTVLSWCHHWFLRKKMSEKRAQKFHSDDSSLPRDPGTLLTYTSPSPQTLLTLLCDPY